MIEKMAIIILVKSVLKNDYLYLMKLSFFSAIQFLLQIKDDIILMK